MTNAQNAATIIKLVEEFSPQTPKELLVMVLALAERVDQLETMIYDGITVH